MKIVIEIDTETDMDTIQELIELIKGSKDD
jgi:hypothetical protein